MLLPSLLSGIVSNLVGAESRLIQLENGLSMRFGKAILEQGVNSKLSFSTIQLIDELPIVREQVGSLSLNALRKYEISLSVIEVYSELTYTGNPCIFRTMLRGRLLLSMACHKSHAMTG